MSLFQETVGCHLVSVHNIKHQLDLMRDVRQAIQSNSVELFLKQFIHDYYGPIQSEEPSEQDSLKIREVPQWVRDAVNHMGYKLHF